MVYRACYGDRGLWIRPTVMFLETVIVDGRSCPRFQFLATLLQDAETVRQRCLGRLMAGG
ncbi:MAG: DUF1653 domain-containing protein [Nitrospirae bacterium]|nr:MAG: DUF1653 domain-containing protein [Nitrospirota bacterium]